MAGENTVSAGGTVPVLGAVAGPIAVGIAFGFAVGTELTRGSGGDMRSLSQAARVTAARHQAATVMGVGIAFPFQEIDSSDAGAEACVRTPRSRVGSKYHTIALRQDPANILCVCRTASHGSF